MSEKPFEHRFCGRMAEDCPHLPPDDLVQIQITNELDLHAFRADEIGALLPEYFAECRKKNIIAVRVIHGKDTGALREGVHRLLEKTPGVKSWQWPADAESGGWGATWVWLNDG